MPIIIRIKQAMLQLDAGGFQALCDDWLSRKTGGIICSLGAQAGTEKTTKGTPDTYFRTDDGRYIFVEYTTQTDGLFNKIKTDIKKCLNEKKTGIPCSEINKIIYCHTSSNITVMQDVELHTICSDAGVELKLYGIDEIAADLAKSFSAITKDHLGIPLDTGQISFLDEFLAEHDSNKMMAPLGLAFHFREKELNQLDEAFLGTNAVILTGSPGVGKTRIAIEFAMRYAADNSALALVIHDKQLPLYDDIQTHIMKGYPYIIIVDDANQITQLDHILELLKMDRIKLLITVREYAKANVASQVKQFTYPKVVSIGNFSDDELKTIVEDELGIKNGNYLKRVADISDGNVRIAILAGKLAVEKNTLESIADVSDLYEEYYGRILSQIKPGSDDDDKEMLIAAILAFFETMQESQIDALLNMIPVIGFDRNTFLKKIKKLGEKEIVDIFYDRAFRIADQTFGNFIVKYSLVDKKLIPLSDVIKGSFSISKSRTINAINMLLKVFSSGETRNYVVNQLRVVWDELKNSKSPAFLEYMKSTYVINPLETLLILKESIDKSADHPITLTKGNFEEKRFVNSIEDDTLEIIGGFVRQHLEIKSAAELYLAYFEKRPDLYAQFLSVIDQNFIINIDSERFGYGVQVELLNTFIKKASHWSNNNVTLMFLEVAKKLMNYTFSPTESGRGNTLILYTIPLADSEECRAYRAIIWGGLSELISVPEFCDCVLDVLLKLFSYYPRDDSKEVALFDAENAKELFFKLSPNKLQHCVVASKFIHWVRKVYTDFDVSFMKVYVENPNFMIITMLEGDEKSFVRYEQQIEGRKAEIQRFVVAAGLKEIRQLIDICAEYESFSGDSVWRITVGLDILLDALCEKDASLFVDSVKLYMEKGAPFRLHSERLIYNLRNTIGDTELFSLLQNHDFPTKSSWLYLYFSSLDKDEIRQSHVDAWYAYIEDDALQFVDYRGIDFLVNFTLIDAEIIPSTCERLLNHKERPEKKVEVFCSHFLNAYTKSIEEILYAFSGRLDLLKNLYLTIFRAQHSDSFDYKGKLFIALVNAHPGFLFEYVDTVIDNNIYFGAREAPFGLLYENENYLSIFDGLMGHIASKEWYGNSLIESFVILSSESNANSVLRRDEWVLHFIRQNCDQIELLRNLFPAISMLSRDFRIQCINAFLELNDNPDDFERLYLLSTSGSWSGSEVPLIDQDRQFYRELLASMPSGVKYLVHRKKIEKSIEYKEKYKADVEIREMMERY